MQNPYTGQVLPAARAAKLVRFVKSEVRRMGGRAFPGSHPVSLTRENVQLLEKEAYYVCEKTDGVRFLLVACGRLGCFFLGRKGDVRWVKLALPRRLPKGPLPPNWQRSDCLLDGELMGTTFYIFDAIFVDQFVGNLPLPERLRLVQTEVIIPRMRFQVDDFAVKLKRMYEASATRFVVEQVLPKIDNDGLIFTPVHRPYRPGTDYRLLKWKPPELNSVDFMCKGGKLLCAGGEEVGELDAADGIVECVMKGTWVLLRRRTDKLTANSFRVYKNILKCIQEPVGLEHLYAVCRS